MILLIFYLYFFFAEFVFFLVFLCFYLFVFVFVSLLILQSEAFLFVFVFVSLLIFFVGILSLDLREILNFDFFFPVVSCGVVVEVGKREREKGTRRRRRLQEPHIERSLLDIGSLGHPILKPFYSSSFFLSLFLIFCFLDFSVFFFFWSSGYCSLFLF